MLPPRSVSLISVKAPMLNTRHLYQLDAADNLPADTIPLAVEHKIDHNYPKLLWIPLLNMEHNSAKIPRKTVIGKLQPIDLTSPGQLMVQAQQRNLQNYHACCPSQVFSQSTKLISIQ